MPVLSQQVSGQFGGLTWAVHQSIVRKSHFSNRSPKRKQSEVSRGQTNWVNKKKSTPTKTRDWTNQETRQLFQLVTFALSTQHSTHKVWYNSFFLVRCKLWLVILNVYISYSWWWWNFLEWNKQYGAKAISASKNRQRHPLKRSLPYDTFLVDGWWLHYAVFICIPRGGNHPV